MAVDSKALKNHPGANRDYNRTLAARLEARLYGFPIPKLPNKYVPHIGAKQRAKRRTNTGE